MTPEKLLLQLVLLYAKDTSEHADILVANHLCKLLKAKITAIFYKDISGICHLRLSGSDYSIKLSNADWDHVVRTLDTANSGEAYTFGPWEIPQFGSTEKYWVTCGLFNSRSIIKGFIVLGRSDVPWDALTVGLIQKISRTIGTILIMRMRLYISEYEKKKLLDKLTFEEKRLRNLFDASPNIIYTCDADDYIASVNFAGLRAFGLSAPDEILGKPFSQLLYNPEDRKVGLKRLFTNGNSATYETILKTFDDRLIYCMESIAVLRDEHGKIRELQGIINDITERIEKERELWRTNLELSELNNKLQKTQEMMVQQEKLASIGQLAAGVAHEINNPLGFLKSNHGILNTYVNKVSSLLEELKVTPLNESQVALVNKLYKHFDSIKEVLNESSEGFERIIRIVSDLKTFSRLDQGEGFAEYDVNAGIESTLVVAWNEIKYVADVEKRLGSIPKIMARGNELNQVWLNILVNAAQAIESAKKEEHGRIVISTWDEKDYIMVSIKDNGPGIPESIRKKSLTPFLPPKSQVKEPG
nr:PAS domain-containing protein [Gracilinema caldarium]